MLLTLVIILLLIGAAVVGSIYSNFLIFYSNFNESENYHKAYYNSIAALERAELVTKQREPGYEGNGGWKIGEEIGTGSFHNGGSDGIIGNFSYLSEKNSTKNTSTVFRTINSKTDRIPAEGKGDIEIMLSTGDSDNYNMMDYNDTQVFLLYYDKSNNNPYSKVSCPSDECQQSKMDAITGVIRLPQKLYETFGDLNVNDSLVIEGQNNDAIVNRQLRGKYKTDTPFTIYSNQNYSSLGVDDNSDSAIRESDINPSESQPGLYFKFGGDRRSPSTRRGKDAKLIIISSKENEITNETDSNGKKFKQILSNENGNYSEKQLRFSLLNLLRSASSSGMIYPFLEYYVDFGTGVSDKYFTINAEGNYADYKINKIIRKPTNKESILGSFTTIF